MRLDPAIRFIAIADSDGKILETIYKKGANPLLTRKESELSIMQSLIRMSTRKTLEAKLGRAPFSTSVYEKITRATISLFANKGKADARLMVSFEKDAKYNYKDIAISKEDGQIRLV